MFWRCLLVPQQGRAAGGGSFSKCLMLNPKQQLPQSVAVQTKMCMKSK
jgi:hypothetical protein